MPLSQLPKSCGLTLNSSAAEGEGAAASAGHLHPDDRSWQAAAALSGQLGRGSSAGRTDPHPGPLETSQQLPGATEETAHHLVKGKPNKPASGRSSFKQFAVLVLISFSFACLHVHHLTCVVSPVHRLTLCVISHVGPFICRTGRGVREGLENQWKSCEPLNGSSLNLCLITMKTCKLRRSASRYKPGGGPSASFLDLFLLFLLYSAGLLGWSGVSNRMKTNQVFSNNLLLMIGSREQV